MQFNRTNTIASTYIRNQIKRSQYSIKNYNYLTDNQVVLNSNSICYR